MPKKLTISEVREIAKKNYSKGGDSIYEAWDDECIQEWIDQYGTKKALKEVFAFYWDMRHEPGFGGTYEE